MEGLDIVNIFDKWIPDFGEVSYKAYPVVLLRLLAGFAMFFAGFEKLVQPIWAPEEGVWSAEGFLRFAAGGGPFHDWLVSLAGNAAVDGLVMWGEILIGLAFILGIFVRFATIMGIIENGLFWIASYMSKDAGEVVTGPFNVGWEHGPIETNAMLIAMYIVCSLVGAGLMYGLDGYIQKTEIVKKHKWMKLLLG